MSAPGAESGHVPRLWYRTFIVFMDITIIEHKIPDLINTSGIVICLIYDFV